MHTRNQNKPPLTAGYNVSRSRSNKSENLDESQQNRRQKIGGGNMGRMNDLRNYIKRLKSSQEKEAEARATSENLHYGLMEDLEKATQEINHLNSQIKMIQGTNKLLQEYNNSLQQYNLQLQADAIKNGDTISKLQKEKNALVEIITRLTDQASLLRNQLENMRASMLEIYNETIRDLLSPNRSTSSCLTLLNKQYTIKHDSAGNTHVPDLTVVDVCSIKEISFLLDQAARSRPRNDIFKAINKSLPSLSDFIFAIAKMEDYVLYRN
ncbi:hypothetical protein HPP92_006295 [Vanilla planifolia]|uniref:Kinesin motor domain-containing protein n=1 Tax=Vanilla planifolia TaxID=51239 RepID=A0A835RVB3_VANPL|nr:hypothetical protein HPP92_006295 [Vanilla planifolia]